MCSSGCGSLPVDHAGHAGPTGRALFDGRSLDGWTVIPGGTWSVEDGVLVGRQVQDDARHGVLLSEEVFGDFVALIRFQAVRGNSGLYFRCEPVKGAVSVHGFQAEIDAENDVGGLYETGGRAWVVRPKAADVATWFKPGMWNEMRVEAQGANIRVYVNGVLSASLVDDPGRLRGHFALQLHGGQDMEVRIDRLLLIDAPSEFGTEGQ
jgi:hypothetical protein